MRTTASDALMNSGDNIQGVFPVTSSPVVIFVCWILLQSYKSYTFDTGVTEKNVQIIFVHFQLEVYGWKDFNRFEKKYELLTVFFGGHCGLH